MIEEDQARWSRTDVQRVLYNIIRKYEQACSPGYTLVKDGQPRERRMPKRFIFFGPRIPALGGDSELLRDAIRIGRETLKDNDWWPDD